MSGSSRIVERSKKNIKDAMLELMYEKEFSRITVNELLVRAGISRGTFYAHFANLEDVRQQLIDDLFDYADSIGANYKPSELAKDPYPILFLMADIMTKSADPTKRLFKFINAYDIGRNLKTWLTKYILSDEELVRQLGGEDQARIYARFISGGMMHVYNNWMADDIKAEPEVLARSLCNMLMGGFNGVIQK
ncbi:MAG TPA: hypothetical protein DIT84_03810 [Clostridiales bacterium]|nr:hypothetical protein [Clostridiales bacterium]